MVCPGLHLWDPKCWLHLLGSRDRGGQEALPRKMLADAGGHERARCCTFLVLPPGGNSRKYSPRSSSFDNIGAPIKKGNKPESGGTTLYCFLGCPEASGLTDFPQNRALLRGCGCGSLWLCPPARTGTQKSQSSGPYSCPFSQRYRTSIVCPFSPVGRRHQNRQIQLHKSNELGEEEEVETEK